MLEKIKNLSKQTKIIIGVVLGFIVLAIIGSFLPEVEGEDVPTTTTTELVLTEEEQLYIELEDILGKYTNRTDDNDNKINRIHDVEITDETITISIGANDNLSTSWVVDGAHQDIIDVMKQIEFDREVVFEIYFGVLDDNFNANETLIILSLISNLDINWDNVSQDDIPTISEEYSKHPDL